MAKKALKGITVEEVTFCKKGMNPGAKISLFKMDKSDPKTFDQIFVDADVLEEKIEATDQLWNMTNALFNSFESIAFSSEIEDAEKKKMLNTSMKEFNNAVKGIIDPLSKIKKGDTPMKKEELAKLLEPLKLTKEQTAVFEQMNDSLEKTKKENEVALAKAVEDAIAKTKEELKKEEVKDETDPLKKAKAEGASEEVLKTIEAMQKTAKDNEDRLEKMEKANLRKSYVERAGVIKAVGSTPEEIADILMDVEKSETVEKVFEILTKSATAMKESGFLKVLGKGGGNDLEGSDAIMAKADTLAIEMTVANPAISKVNAMAKVWELHPELYKEYTTEKRKEVKAS